MSNNTKATTESRQSIDKLFEEPFEPQWMQREREYMSTLDSDLRAMADFKWRQEARKSEERIVANRCKKRKSDHF
jgi:hypothetical protein